MNSGCHAPIYHDDVRTTPTDDRRVITAKEAERELGIKADRVRQWAHRRRLFAVSIGPDQQRWYKLTDVLKLAGLLSCPTDQPVSH